jgi:hypothetical protein
MTDFRSAGMAYWNARAYPAYVGNGVRLQCFVSAGGRDTLRHNSPYKPGYKAAMP